MAIQGDKTINAVCNKTKCFTPTMSKTDIESAIAAEAAARESAISATKTEIQSGTVANATNATKVNNLEIKQDENGVLKIGDVIIPQKKLLWSGSENITSEGTIEVEGVSENDLLEIKWNINGDDFSSKVYLKNKTVNLPCIIEAVGSSLPESIVIYILEIKFSNNNLTIKGAYRLCENSSGTVDFMDCVTFSVKEIYKIIE